MVELSVLSTSGLPVHPVFSVRSGGTRRQQPLPLKVPFALPGPPGPYEVEVFDWTAWSKATRGLPKPDELGLIKVRLTSNDGRPMSVTLRQADDSEALTESVKQLLTAGARDGKLAAAHQMDLHDRATALLTSAASDRKLGPAIEAVQHAHADRARAVCMNAAAQGTLVSTFEAVEGHQGEVCERAKAILVQAQAKGMLNKAFAEEQQVQAWQQVQDKETSQQHREARAASPNKAQDRQQMQDRMRQQAKERFTSAALDGTLEATMEQNSKAAGGPPEAAGELRGEALKTQIDGYFAEHELNQFMKAMFAELLVEKPSDPYGWIAQRLVAAATDEAKGAGPPQPPVAPGAPPASRTAQQAPQTAPEATFKSAMTGPLQASGIAASGGVDQEKAFKRLRMVELRQRALSTIVAGISKNQFTPTLSEVVWKTNAAMSSQGSGDNLYKIKPSLARLRREELRMRAFGTLAGGGLTGKLKDAVIHLT